MLKLSKLIYLADRSFMERYDCPILRDKFVSMEHGPVNSVTLNLINGLIADPANEWNEFISNRSTNYDVGLIRDNLDVDELDELSEAEIEVLSDIADQFKGWNQYRVRDYTHKHCPEWEDPDGSSTPIDHARVFEVLGKAEPQALADAVEEERALSELPTA